MIRVAVIGATGYTGVELIKILLRHKHVQITALTTRQADPIPVRQLIPSLPPEVKLEVETYSFAKVKKCADLVFLCLPHTESVVTAEQFHKAGKIVIDLSADMRLHAPQAYEKWYGFKHPKPAMLKQAVYGLPEFYREKIQTADVIANPGCYPTSVILAAAPLLKKKLVKANFISVDSKSGVSGAGKKLTQTTQFCEVEQNFSAYKVGQHQHTPEMIQVLSELSKKEVRLTFVPHLLPVTRGILSTVYLQREKGVGAEAIRKAFEETYSGKLFVRLKPAGKFPALADVQLTNYCDIGFWADPASEALVVISAIDNLLKGASGQAVQNMNIRCGFQEEEGLKTW